MSFTESLDELVAANESGLLGVHPTWARARLSDVCSILNGFPFSSKHFIAKGGTPLIRIRDVLRGWTETHFVGDFDPEFVVRHGEIVVGMDGDFNCAIWAGEDALLNQRVCKVTPEQRYYDARLLAHALQGYISAINSRTSAITVKHLSSRTLADVPLPLPPRLEQARLVAAIESYFTRLDDVVATLERVQRNLKRYRASVLKAAVEGRLVPTEAELALAEGRSFEPASILLERILAERRRRWEEAELAKLTARGKVPKDDKWKARYEEPVAPNTDSVPDLPEGWCWVTSSQIAKDKNGSICAGPFGTIFKAKDFRPTGVPIIQLRHVKPDRFLTHKQTYMAQAIWERLFRDDYSVFGGELLVTKLGDPPGDSAIFPTSRAPSMLTPDVMKLEVDERMVMPRFVMHYINSTAARQYTFGSAFGTTRLRLTLPLFRAMPIPVPPLPEQERMVAVIDHLFTVADAVDEGVRRDERRCARLRQSILKWAFEGRLVDQDPTDEPASALLERIRAKRESAVSGAGRNRSRRNRGEAGT